MTFSEILNGYLTRLGCTGAELARASGLSPAVISRYRSGLRVPERDSVQLHALAAGLAAAAQTRGLSDEGEEEIFAALSNTLTEESRDFGRMADNFNELISALELSISELARSMSYDASYLSRIRAGQRRPADWNSFADGVCRFVARRRTERADRAAVAALIGCPASELGDERACFTALREWFVSGAAQRPDRVGSFLSKLDEFDLNEYIRSIRFDELKVPSAPFQLPTSRCYYGLAQMRQGELDFFKATVLSRSVQPVFMCSDMEMEDMAEDIDFGKKWMFAIAMTLKKGLRMNVIHNIDRPFPEMMLGLESWIPLYMTGQIAPYYFKSAHNDVYCHLNYVSGAAALSGECVAGFHARAKYYLTKKKEEVDFYREKSDLLLKKAQPLMDIYRADAEGAYRAFLLADAHTGGARRGILSSPPLYTMPEELLRRILTRNALPQADAARLTEYAAWQRGLVETVLAENSVVDEMPCLSEEEFARYPVALSLEGAFCEQDVCYTYAEYAEHLQAVREFEAAHPNYTAQLNLRRAFRHIQIMLHEGRWAMISKSKSPAIHFVVRQTKLRQALENLTIPVAE